MPNNLSVIIGADTTGFKKSVEDAKSLLEKYTKSEDELIKKLKQGNDVHQSSITSYQRVMKALDRVSSGAMSTAQSEKVLTAQVKELKIQYANLSETTKNSDFGKAMAKSCEDAENHLKQLRQQLDAVSEGEDKVKSKSASTGVSFDQITKYVAKYASALVVAKAALGVLKDAFLSSESNIDEWGRTVAGAESAYRVFCNALNSGNWSNFFKNLNDAIKGARDLYDALDELGTIKTTNEAAIAIVEAEIAKLRVAKQEGKNVDKQLKDAEARLKKLKMQAVEQGKKVGQQQIVQAIKEQNPNVSDKDANVMAKALIKQGKTYLDHANRKIKELEEKAGTKEVVANVGTGTTGATQTVKKQVVATENLTKTEQKQLAAYKAVVEAERNIGAGIKTYADAVREEAGVSQGEFKVNKMTGVGSGGSGKKDKQEEVYMTGTISELTQQLEKEQKKLNEQLIAGTDEYKQQLELVSELAFYIDRLKKGLPKKDELKFDLDPEKLNTKGNTSNPFALGATKDLLNPKLKIDEKKFNKYKEKIAEWQELQKQLEQDRLNDTIMATANAFEALGDAIGGAAGEWVGFAGQALASTSQMLQSLSQIIVANQAAATAKGIQSASGLAFPFNLAAIATVVATIASLFASLPAFASGGIIGGNSRVGDMNLARVNSGEMILNGTQQKHLFDLLNSGGHLSNRTQPGDVKFKITGSNLIGVQKNQIKRNNRL